MPIYKNLSAAAKTFHGVKFEPGDEHKVDGFINDQNFVMVTPKTKSTVTKSAASTQPKRALNSAVSTKTGTAKKEVTDNGTDSN